MSDGYNLKKGIVCIAVTTVAFSTMEIAGKMIAGSIHPMQMLFIRFLIGGLCLLPFAVRELRVRKVRLGIKDFLFFAALGTLGVVVSMSFFQNAILHTKAAIVAVIFSINPLFTAPLAQLILKEEMTKTKWAALVLSIVGVLLIFNPLGENPDLFGMALALLAALSFSLYTVVGKTRVGKYGSLAMNSFSFLSGVTVMFFILLFSGLPIVSGIDGSNILHLIYLGVFVTGIGYLCYFAAMKYTSAVTASTVFFIKPALASVLSFLLLDERMSLLSIFGILLIIAASVLMFRAGRIKA